MKKVLIIILMLINIYIINKPIESNLKSTKDKPLNSKCLEKMDEIFDYLKNQNLINYFIEKVKDIEEKKDLIYKVKATEIKIEQIRKFWQKNLGLLFLFGNQINILPGYIKERSKIYTVRLNLQNFNYLFNINSNINFNKFML